MIVCAVVRSGAEPVAADDAWRADSTRRAEGRRRAARRRLTIYLSAAAAAGWVGSSVRRVAGCVRVQGSPCKMSTESMIGFCHMCWLVWPTINLKWGKQSWPDNGFRTRLPPCCFGPLCTGAHCTSLSASVQIVYGRCQCFDWFQIHYAPLRVN